MRPTELECFVEGAPAVAVEATRRLDERPLLIVGGRQRGERSLLDMSQHWYGYDLGVIVRIDGSGVTTALEYDSRPGARGTDDPVLFKSASRVGDRLYCCTQTEVIVYSMPGLDELAYISLPIFNDVHHVVPSPDGTLLVAVSGLEAVVEVTLTGEIVREWNVLGEDTWSIHSPAVDYRHGVDLKPHRAHPNYVFFVGVEPFVTRFECRDAIALNDPARRIDIGGERVHDGVVDNGVIHFTTVDGRVVMVDQRDLRVVDRRVLRRPGQHDDDDVVAGWCRALHFDDEYCWVGFSRIRPTRLRQTVAWIRSGGAEQAPTRIARYRRADWTCDAEIDLEPFGLNAVFSVVPA
jgi:hypothetical protein